MILKRTFEECVSLFSYQGSVLHCRLSQTDDHIMMAWETSITADGCHCAALNGTADKKYAYLLARTYYPELIASGVKIYDILPP